MGWQTVFICDTHWEEEGGKLVPIDLPDGVVPVTEPCYRCGEAATIPVRRLIDEVSGGGRCEVCAEEGIVRINETWYCLEHLGQGFHPVRTIQEAFLEVFGDRVVLNDPPDDAA